MKMTKINKEMNQTPAHDDGDNYSKNIEWDDNALTVTWKNEKRRPASRYKQQSDLAEWLTKESLGSLNTLSFEQIWECARLRGQTLNQIWQEHYYGVKETTVEPA